jgi:EAL domain-containing protein (putative c-di-GMP-specific phosphodiesterase class I)
MPDQFIPLAEETGLIISLSNWVIRSLYGDERQIAGIIGLRQYFCYRIPGKRSCRKNKEILHETGLEPNRLEIEVTENVTLSDPEKPCRP